MSGERCGGWGRTRPGVGQSRPRRCRAPRPARNPAPLSRCERGVTAEQGPGLGAYGRRVGRGEERVAAPSEPSVAGAQGPEQRRRAGPGERAAPHLSRGWTAGEEGRGPGARERRRPEQGAAGRAEHAQLPRRGDEQRAAGPELRGRDELGGGAPVLPAQLAALRHAEELAPRQPLIYRARHMRRGFGRTSASSA